MQNTQLREFVDSVIKEKNLSGVDQETINKLVDDLTNRLEEQINRALINELNDNQFEQFEKLINDQDTEKLSTFFTDNSIPVTEIATRTMTKFRMSYLGS